MMTKTKTPMQRAEKSQPPDTVHAKGGRPRGDREGKEKGRGVGWVSSGERGVCDAKGRVPMNKHRSKGRGGRQWGVRSLGRERMARVKHGRQEARRRSGGRDGRRMLRQRDGCRRESDRVGSGRGGGGVRTGERIHERIQPLRGLAFETGSLDESGIEREKSSERTSEGKGEGKRKETTERKKKKKNAK